VTACRHGAQPESPAALCADTLKQFTASFYD
jgi:hypothetical protein